MPAPKCPNPQCEYFNRTLPNSAQVCPMCGTPLGNVVARPAAQPAYQAPASAQPAGVGGTPYSPIGTTRPILKLMHASGREFTLRGEEAYIGRRGGTVKPKPEIDLTGIPNDQVVSRPHARVYWDQTYSTYTFVDSDSRNGSYLNGHLLTAGEPYQLINGDVLQLGKENLVQFTISIA
jgi:pSer/pThr/pTyr-binding forkhead associated (FHA) protein